MIKNKVVLIFTMFFFSTCSIFAAGKTFSGDVKDSVKYISKVSAKKCTIAPKKGLFKDEYWSQLETAIKEKENCIFYLDFSKITIEDSTKDADIFNTIFAGCKNIGGIKFPQGITYIPSYSFESCENLEYVYFPKNVVHSIGYQAFSEDKKLNEIHLYEFDGYLNEAFKYCDEIEIVEMPDHPIRCSYYGGYNQHTFGASVVKSIITPSGTIEYDEWCIRNEELEPQYSDYSVKASSCSSENYSEQNIRNHNWKSWIDGKDDEGIGESFELTLEQPTSLEYICIKNGYGDLQNYWNKNRVKSGYIILDDDENDKIEITLSDIPQAQYVYIQRFGAKYSKIKFVISDVYKGNDSSNETCIDEIAINASINREEVYGGYYTSPQIAYELDPETKNMMKKLYEIDVGANNVKEENGLIKVLSSDWETGEKYWSYVSASLNGTLKNGFFPGTGGGHSYNEYQIILVPNGRHLLFIWHNESWGGNEYFDPQFNIYVWEKSNWKNIPFNNSEKSLENLNKVLVQFEKNNTAFKVHFESYYRANTVLTLCPTTYSNTHLYVELSFEFNDLAFETFDKTPQSVAGFGTVQDFEQLGDWKSEVKENLLVYACAFNKDSQVIQYLIDKGMDCNEPIEYYDFGITPLEAWNLGNNSDEIRAILLKNGATYSPQMLVDAYNNGNFENFKELCPLVKDYQSVVEAISYNPSKQSSDFRKKCLTELTANGAKLDSYFCNSYTMGELFIITNDVDLLKYYISLGNQLPQYFAYGKTAVHSVVKEWLEKAKWALDDEYWALEEPYYKKTMDYVLSLNPDYTLNDKDGWNILTDICYWTPYTQLEYDTALKMIKSGVNVNVNADNSVENHPLYNLYYQYFDDFYYDSDDYETEIKYVLKISDLLIENGSLAEYALFALFEQCSPNEIRASERLLQIYKKLLSNCHTFTIEYYDRDLPSYVSYFYSDDKYEDFIKEMKEQGFGIK